MTEFKSFDQLWGACEQSFLYKNDPNEIINELLIKIKLYSLTKNSPDNLEVKTRLFGEILFVLSELSNSENINIFAALYEALKNKSIL